MTWTLIAAWIARHRGAIARVSLALAVLVIIGGGYLGWWVEHQRRETITAQRDAARTRVTALEAAEQRWMDYAAGVEDSLRRANQSRREIGLQLAEAQQRLAVEQARLRSAARDLEEQRAASVTAPGCREAWGQALAEVGWLDE